MKHSDNLREFIESQEKAGNKVLIPKINKKILAVKIGTSNLIKIYSIKLKTFIRQFVFTTKEVEFGQHTYKDTINNFNILTLGTKDRFEKVHTCKKKKLIRFTDYID